MFSSIIILCVMPTDNKVMCTHTRRHNTVNRTGMFKYVCTIREVSLMFPTSPLVFFLLQTLLSCDAVIFLNKYTGYH